MLGYFSVALTLTLLLHLCFDRRLVARLALPARARRRVRAGLLVHALIVPPVLVACLRAPAPWAAWMVPLGRVAFLDLGACVMLAFCLLGRDVVLGVLGASAAVRNRLRPRPLVAATTRRQWLARGLDCGALVAAGALTGAGAVQAARLPTLRRVTVRIPGAPAAISGLRIAHLSDLHIGPTLRGDFLAQVVAAVNAAAPDLVVITGDLVDGFVAQLASQVAALGALRAPLGCFFVTGNHEYYYRAAEWTEALPRLGVRVLLNEGLRIGYRGASVFVAGVCDEAAAAALPAQRQDLARALRGGADADLRVLLAHRPRCAPEAAALGVSLQLSGHTHAGQLVPFTWIERLLSRYVVGLYEVGALRLYVSPGTGYWGPPLRHGPPQEIAILELRGEAAGELRGDAG